MTSNNDEAILSEAKDIINACADQLGKDEQETKTKHFAELERNIFQSFGFNDGGHVFFMRMLAHNADEVVSLIEKLPNEVGVLDQARVDAGEKPNRAMGVSLVANGDLYTLLTDKHAAYTFANDEDAMGVIVRTGATISHKALELDIAPSEAPDKQDAVLTLMIADGFVYTAARNATTPDEVIAQEFDLKDYEVGSQKLIDALIHFYAMPRAIREQRPDVFAAMLKDYTIKAEMEEDN